MSDIAAYGPTLCYLKGSALYPYVQAFALADRLDVRGAPFPSLNKHHSRQGFDGEALTIAIISISGIISIICPHYIGSVSAASRSSSRHHQPHRRMNFIIIWIFAALLIEAVVCSTE